MCHEGVYYTSLNFCVCVDSLLQVVELTENLQSSQKAWEEEKELLNKQLDGWKDKVQDQEEMLHREQERANR